MTQEETKEISQEELDARVRIETSPLGIFLKEEE